MEWRSRSSATVPTQDAPEKALLERLPAEILLAILWFVGPKDVAGGVSLVSRTLRVFAEDNALWHRFYLSHQHCFHGRKYDHLGELAYSHLLEEAMSLGKPAASTQSQTNGSSELARWKDQFKKRVGSY